MVETAPPDDLSFLSDGTEMRGLIRALDWSSTPLGAPQHWPRALKTLAGLMLASKQPMFIAWGPDKTWLYNDAFTPILGAKHPAALGRPSMEVWSEARNVLEPMFEQVFSGQSVSIEDFSIWLDRHGGSEEAHFEFAYTPARGDCGSIEGLFGSCIETTARVLAERRQAEELERQRRQFLCAPGFIAILKGPEHIFEFANLSYLRLVGDRELLGRTVRDVFPDLEGQGFFELLDRVYQTGERYIAHQTPIKLIRTSGGAPENRYLDFVYEPMLDQHQHVSGIFVEGFDVTGAREAHERLQELNLTLERRVEQRTTDLKNIQIFYTHSAECHAVLSLRHDGRFQYDEINPATLRLYGMTRDEVIGRTVDDIFKPSVAVEVTAHLAECLQQNMPYRYTRSQGATTVEAVATPIPAEPGTLPRVAVTARDITDRQTLEEQLRQAQKMEAVGQLTGGLAHDFNNMLQGIIGSLDCIRRRIELGHSQDVDKFINSGLEAANRAASLTHRLLAFSRRQALDPRPTNVNHLIFGMEELVRRTMGPNISVEVVVPSELWLSRIDAPQLESAVLNLSINARDAMPDGGKLTIQAANKSLDNSEAEQIGILPGQYVSLSVTDTGTGMTPEVAARAFDPFYTTKPIGQGTGLGLSMIYGFVRQSGGQVRIETELGKGTTVCVYLPRYLGAADEQQPAESLKQPEKGGGETILLIDDEKSIRMLAIEVLTENHYQVLEARDASSALTILESGKPIDLLITDVGLPGNMNGRQIADAARTMRNGLKVLFITGYADSAAIGRGRLEAGMEILVKPFQMTTLVAKVQQLLRKTSPEIPVH